MQDSKDNILYVSENYTSFSLRCNGEEIDDNFQDITMGSQFKLLCAKCNKPLTLEEYKLNKLQSTKNKRKINGVFYDNLDTEDMMIYSLEHKRCSHK